MRKSLFIITLGLSLAACQSGQENSDAATIAEEPKPVFTPDYASLSERELPEWYNDAKLGIFIHWGLYSVPGWAKATELTLEETLAKDGARTWFMENPYAEWYYNSLRIDGSATAIHHKETYGEDFSYFDFVGDFNREIQKFNPDEWATTFKDAGAEYVVLTTKHHDGFLLWPSEQQNPFHENYYAGRDLVGELTEAVRSKDMRMGLYYSSGLDWTFNDQPIVDFQSLFTAIPQTEEYAKYIDNHWRELMQRYNPSILWADIGSPMVFNDFQLIADYYNQNPEGLVNNRHTARGLMGDTNNPAWFDFLTPEYTILDSISEKKWETCRGIGLSFGYNQREDVADFLSDEELIQSFVDIVSKNGNLLLNVGPRADGSIQEGQLRRLKALGGWLRSNGDGIYGTRPWTRAESKTAGGMEVRFTQKDGLLYMFILGTPEGTSLVIENLPEANGKEVRLLDGGRQLDASVDASGRLKINASESFTSSPVLGFSIKL